MGDFDPTQMQSNYFMIFLDFDLANMEGAGDYGAGFGAQD